MKKDQVNIMIKDHFSSMGLSYELLKKIKDLEEKQDLVEKSNIRLIGKVKEAHSELDGY